MHRYTRRTLTPSERRIAEAARLEAQAFEMLGRCVECLDLARAFVVRGEAGSLACPACGGAWQRAEVLTLLGRVIERRSQGRASARLPGF